MTAGTIEMHVSPRKSNQLEKKKKKKNVQIQMSEKTEKAPFAQKLRVDLKRKPKKLKKPKVPPASFSEHKEPYVVPSEHRGEYTSAIAPKIKDAIYTVVPRNLAGDSDSNGLILTR